MIRIDDFPTVDDVARCLNDQALALLWDDPVVIECEPGNDPEIDIRLQVWEGGSWTVHTGASDYDQDHSGFWGASSVAASFTPALLRETARDLINQAIDDAAMNDELEETEEEDL